MYVDDENGTVTFKSSQVFNKYAELYVKYEGIDLTEAVGPEIDFIFSPEYGTIESVNYKEIKYDLEKGNLELTAGLVSQFTEYGFITEIKQNLNKLYNLFQSPLIEFNGLFL